MKIAVAGASGQAGSAYHRGARPPRPRRHRHAGTRKRSRPTQRHGGPKATCWTRRPCRAVGWARRRRQFRTLLPATAKTDRRSQGLAKVALSGGGGAGSLEVAPGVRLVTTPNFPRIKAEAEERRCFLICWQGKELN